MIKNFDTLYHIMNRRKILKQFSFVRLLVVITIEYIGAVFDIALIQRNLLMWVIRAVEVATGYGFL